MQIMYIPVQLQLLHCHTFSCYRKRFSDSDNQEVVKCLLKESKAQDPTASATFIRGMFQVLYYYGMTCHEDIGMFSSLGGGASIQL